MKNPRKIAVDSLEKIFKGRFVDDVLNTDKRVAELDARDKGFVRAMLLTTLRHKGEIDHFLHQFNKTTKSDELRLGVAQMKYMDLPAHAVVNEMVELGETIGHKSFINSILRKASEKQLQPNKKLNFPKWMLGSWKKAYGQEKLEQILDIFLSEQSYIDLTYKGGEHKRVEAQDITKIDGFEEGEFWVQDASQIHAVELLGDIEGKTVLDMCAAPGGKTAQLIDKRAVVTAMDSSQTRIDRLLENLDRLEMACEIICLDARTPSNGRKFDKILIDAPCTATGTIRKHPEILHQRGLDDVKELVRIQNELLDSAYSLLEDGGELVFSTCSLQYEECEGLVRKLEKFELIEEKRVLPCDREGGIGGAYCAKLRKV